MSEDIVISAEGLGKRYLIGHAETPERYVALRDVLARSARNFGRSVMDIARGRAGVEGDTIEEFWALRDVDFEIKRGEVVGIIGRNGAGKSTLLKILSRITEPTIGRVKIAGRIASLLEVGTGFHPELTGRENIFLNGAILGMTRAEIKRKFDEIVAFAEIEQFLDTPVKRYSSGMYVRLAFAVAAHLEPEILIVDEVLAVGDAEFQKKCLGKMQDVAGHGRTVLFVSHNMAAIQRLCSRAIMLDRGSVRVSSSDVHDCIQTYLAIGRELHGSQWRNTGDDYDNDSFIPHSFEISATARPPGRTTGPLSDFQVTIEGEVLKSDPMLLIGVTLYGPDGQRIYTSGVHDHLGNAVQSLPCGPVRFQADLPSEWLNEGEYELELCAMIHNRRFLIQPGVGPRVRLNNTFRYASPTWDRARDGPAAPQIQWRLDELIAEKVVAATGADFP
jgi:lipopolysaccharide transport system ATP-binding protein